MVLQQLAQDKHLTSFQTPGINALIVASIPRGGVFCNRVMNRRSKGRFFRNRGRYRRIKVELEFAIAREDIGLRLFRLMA
jgi:hypothetical protein